MSYRCEGTPPIPIGRSSNAQDLGSRTTTRPITNLAPPPPSQYEEREFAANFVIDEGPEPIYSVATPRHSMNNDAFERDVVAFGVPGEVRLALQDTLIHSIGRWGFPELQSIVVLDDNVVDGATVALGTSGLHLVHLGRADGNSGSVLLLAGDQDAIRVTTVGVRFTYNRDDDSYSTGIGEVLHVSAPAGITGDDEFGSNIVVAEEYLVVAARSSSRCTEGNGKLFVYRCTMNTILSGDVRAASDCVNEWNASGPVSRHCGPAGLVNVADNLDILFQRWSAHSATPWKVVSGGFWVDLSVAQDDQLAKVVPELPTDTKDVQSVMVPGGSAQVFRDHSTMRFPFVAFWYDATLTVYYGDDVGVGPVWQLTHGLSSVRPHFKRLIPSGSTALAACTVQESGPFRSSMTRHLFLPPHALVHRYAVVSPTANVSMETIEQLRSKSSRMLHLVPTRLSTGATTLRLQSRTKAAVRAMEALMGLASCAPSVWMRILEAVCASTACAAWSNASVFLVTRVLRHPLASATLVAVRAPLLCAVVTRSTVRTASVSCPHHSSVRRTIRVLSLAWYATSPMVRVSPRPLVTWHAVPSGATVMQQGVAVLRLAVRAAAVSFVALTVSSALSSPTMSPGATARR